MYPLKLQIFAAFSPEGAKAYGATTEPVLMWEKAPDPEDYQMQYNFTQYVLHGRVCGLNMNDLGGASVLNTCLQRAWHNLYPCCPTCVLCCCVSGLPSD